MSVYHLLNKDDEWTASTYGFYNGADPSRFVPGDELLSIHHIAALPVTGRAVLLDVDRHLRAVGRPIEPHSSRAVSAQELEDTRELDSCHSDAAGRSEHEDRVPGM
jgi:hypothetical protein